MNENIERIKKDLADNYHDANDEVLTDIFNHFLSIASDVSNRDKNDKQLIPYVHQAVIATYLRRGDEGKESSSEGGMSSGYVDIEEKLRKDVLSIRRGNF